MKLLIAAVMAALALLAVGASAHGAADPAGRLGGPVKPLPRVWGPVKANPVRWSVKPNPRSWGAKPNPRGYGVRPNPIRYVHANAVELAAVGRLDAIGRFSMAGRR